MKNRISLLFFFALMLLLLMDCRREPKATIKSVTNGDDSLYQGTKYVIGSAPGGPTADEIAFSLPTLSNPYKDSLTVEGVLLGRRLFYDKHLSNNQQLACASCHLLNHAFADSIPFATNVSGINTRKAPRLVNLAWQPSFFWDGRQPTIMAQAQDAAHNELGINAMNAITYLQNDTVYAKLFKKAFGRPGTISERTIYLGIQEFLMTVISVNSRFDSVQRGQAMFTNAETDAFQTLFLGTQGECFHCHAGSKYIMATFGFGQIYRNNGLQTANTFDGYADGGRGIITGDSADYGLFKNPTLRNVALGGPYMHDGRYKTLQQVINFYSDSLKLSPNADPFIVLHMDTANGQTLSTGGMHFSATQKAELLTLLQDLTDTSYLNNPNYKNPF